MKTNTLVNAETQANLETAVRIEQLKLGVDWHADHFRVVRMCDGQSPQPAQRLTPRSFLPFVQKQITLAAQVFVLYEAGPGGFHLHRQLIALGATAFVVHPQKATPTGKRLRTLDNLYVTKTILKLKGKWALTPAWRLGIAVILGMAFWVAAYPNLES